MFSPRTKRRGTPPGPALPRSIFDNRGCRLLYACDAKAIAEFVHSGKPLSDEEVESNESFMQIVLSRELGPSVDYQSISTNLSMMRNSMGDLPVGSEIFQFFSQLLNLHETWKKAAMKFIHHDIHIRMIGGFFVDRSDGQLLAYLDYLNPRQIQEYEANCASFSDPERQQAFSIQYERIKRDSDILTKRLYDVKKSDEMWKRMGQLAEAIEVHAQLMTNLGLEDAKKSRERSARRAEQKRQNQESLGRQMGQVGNMPLNNVVVAAVEEIMADDHRNFFSFPEQGCIQKKNGTLNGVSRQ